ncbi:MAG: TraB/GumN family protein [Amphiplicatus sp.]
MRYFSRLAALFAAATLCPPPAAALGAPPPGAAVPPMWRLADADSEIWLLGTFHILPKDLDWRSPPVAAAFDGAETVWFEAEVDTPAARQKTVQIIMTQGFNPPGETLSAMLAPEDASRLAEVTQELGLPLSAIDPMRPWQAFLTLSVQFIVNQGFDPGSGVETKLLAEARAAGRELRFFETIEEQLALFTTLDPETEKKLLVVTLRDWDKQQAQFDALFEAWRTGDAEAIDRLMNETLRAEAPKVYDALIVRRNEAWAAEIAGLMAGSGRALVAVGAAHLAGERSVPALLRERGFTVERYGLEAAE